MGKILCFLLFLSSYFQGKENSFSYLMIDKRSELKIDTIIKKKKIIEKFDFELYKKTNNGETPYKRKNGNVILSFVFEKGEGGYIEERMNIIPYYTVLKEYYSDGSIKLKETYIGQATKTGISEYYDKKGRVTRINEDKKFGRIKPLDVLKFIEKKDISI